MVSPWRDIRLRCFWEGETECFKSSLTRCKNSNTILCHWALVSGYHSNAKRKWEQERWGRDNIFLIGGWIRRWKSETNKFCRSEGVSSMLTPINK